MEPQRSEPMPRAIVNILPGVNCKQDDMDTGLTYSIRRMTYLRKGAHILSAPADDRRRTQAGVAQSARFTCAMLCNPGQSPVHR